MIKKLLLPILLLLGGIGSIVIGSCFILGTLLTLLGAGAAIWTYFRSLADAGYNGALMDSVALLLVRGGLGNMYTESVQLEIRRTGRCKDAIKRLQHALSIDPNDVQALSVLTTLLALNIAFRMWAMGVNVAPSGAILYVRRLARRGRKLDPSSPTFVDVLGMLADHEGNHEIARMWYRKSATLRPDPYWRLLMTTSYGMSGDFDNALSQTAAAIHEGARGWVVDLYMGRDLASMGRYSEATQYLEKARRARGLHPFIIEQLKKCYLLQLMTAKTVCSNLLFILIASSAFPRRSIGYTIWGAAIIAIVLLALIRRLLWVTLGGLPNMGDALTRFAKCGNFETAIVGRLLDLRHYEAALNASRIATRRFPGHLGYGINLATCHALCGDREAAIRVTERLLLQNPNCEPLRWSLECFRKDVPITGIAYFSDPGAALRIDYREDIT
jgi:tetratricopeptide (TPR) repeat protein